jgi:hypothetical protein
MISPETQVEMLAALLDSLHIDTVDQTTIFHTKLYRKERARIGGRFVSEVPPLKRMRPFT